MPHACRVACVCSAVLGKAAQLGELLVLVYLGSLLQCSRGHSPLVGPALCCSRGSKANATERSGICVAAHKHCTKHCPPQLSSASRCWYDQGDSLRD